MSRSYLQPPGKFFGRQRQQAKAIKAGRALRAQLDFARYLQKRTADPSHIFRDHLRNIDGAVFYFLDLQSQYLTHLAPGDVHPLHPDIDQTSSTRLGSSLTISGARER